MYNFGLRTCGLDAGEAKGVKIRLGTLCDVDHSPRDCAIYGSANLIQAAILNKRVRAIAMYNPVERYDQNICEYLKASARELLEVLRNCASECVQLQLDKDTFDLSLVADCIYTDLAISKDDHILGSVVVVTGDIGFATHFGLIAEHKHTVERETFYPGAPKLKLHVYAQP